MYLIQHKVYNDYRAINKADEYQLRYYPQYKLIKKPLEIANILKGNFNSARRGGQYNPNLPSVTQLIGELYPVDFRSESGLLRWLNNRTKTDQVKTNATKNTACEKGTALHEVLEKHLIDKGEITGECLSSYTDSDEILETLENFRAKEAGRIKSIKTEFFLQTSYCQGTVDLLCEYDGVLTLADWKTTSKKNKSTLKGVFSTPSSLGQYKRQLALYTIMMDDCGVLTPEQIGALEYKIFQFHFVRKDYKVFSIPRAEIQSLEKEIIKVISWYDKHLGMLGEKA